MIDRYCTIWYGNTKRMSEMCDTQPGVCCVLFLVYIASKVIGPYSISVPLLRSCPCLLIPHVLQLLCIHMYSPTTPVQCRAFLWCPVCVRNPCSKSCDAFPDPKFHVS
ncbi:hypothetical protein N656DRAFT_241442 [Canariomyces notabilis]|uniref:Uncharacterized protein n=1 Tax=Canariomyces notabilis TaxID=2074819 RepID=A0AAN6YW78_9PEZI|nr:hypothetical protein N656DRAFT_241442 [Canariomyces arenarius]